MYPPRRSLFFATYLAFATALLLSGLFWLIQFPPSAHAQSHPEALGSISGTVRNAQGEPLSGIHVTLTHDGSEASVRSTTTDAQGEYKILSVPPGNYNLRFEDSGKVYATTYYANAALVEEADMVSVSGNDLTGIDMELAPGGTISLTTHPTLTETKSYLTLRLYARTTTGRWIAYDSIGYPWHDKELVFYGLPDGVYRLCVFGIFSPFGQDFNECYDNVLVEDPYSLPPANATDIVVNGANHQTIEIQFGDISLLQGTVQSNSGEPLANIRVEAIPKAYWGESYSVRTDTQGRFQFGWIKSDNYLLRAVDDQHKYFTTYYEDTPSAAEATPLNITWSSRYSLTVTMQRGGQITGTVRLDGGGIPSSISVRVYQLEPDGSWRESNACSFSLCYSYFAPTGAYTITSLPAGTYRVGAMEWLSGAGSMIGFYGGSDLQSADDVQVTLDETIPNINLVLGEGKFEGTIIGTARANGAPAPDIEVGLFTSLNFSSLSSPKPFVSTTTDSEGNYRFDGLANGFYYVGFRDPLGLYATTFYGGDTFQASSVAISGTMTVDNIDGALSLGSTIRGRIKRAPGSSPADFRIVVRDSNRWTALPYIDVHTDADGNYEITGLNPGTYQVGAGSPTYIPNQPSIHFYPWGGDEYHAGNIEVGSNEIIEDINIPIEVVPNLFLPQIDGRTFLIEVAPSN